MTFKVTPDTPLAALTVRQFQQLIAIELARFHRQPTDVASADDDTVQHWLKNETWAAGRVVDPLTQTEHVVIEHRPAVGEPLVHITARYRYWCQLIGQNPIGPKMLAIRLRGAGFDRIDRPGKAHARVWRRPLSQCRPSK